MNKLNANQPDDGGGGTEATAHGVRHRRGSNSRDNTSKTNEPKEKDYTDDQVASVKRYVHVVLTLCRTVKPVITVAAFHFITRLAIYQNLNLVKLRLDYPFPS